MEYVRGKEIWNGNTARSTALLHTHVCPAPNFGLRAPCVASRWILVRLACSKITASCWQLYGFVVLVAAYHGPENCHGNNKLETQFSTFALQFYPKNRKRAARPLCFRLSPNTMRVIWMETDVGIDYNISLDNYGVG